MKRNFFFFSIFYNFFSGQSDNIWNIFSYLILQPVKKLANFKISLVFEVLSNNNYMHRLRPLNKNV